MRQVYICSSVLDSAKAVRICEFLEANDIACWLVQRDASHGEQIMDAIDQCDVFLSLFSEIANNNVHFETGIALSKNKKVIIALLDNAPLPFDFLEQRCVKLFDNWNQERQILLKMIQDSLVQEENDFRADGSGKRVFLSHKSDDFQEVERFRKLLESRSISCWIAPRDIPLGSNYAREIPDAIKNCKCVLVFVSKRSQMSENVINEIEIAVRHKKTIIPVRLEDCELVGPFMYHLNNKQWIKLNSKEDIEKLVSAIGFSKRDDNEAEINKPADRKKMSIRSWIGIVFAIAALLMWKFGTRIFRIFSVSDVLYLTIILLFTAAVFMITEIIIRIKERNKNI